MNDDFSQQVLDKIEHEHVRPLPKWVVFLHRVMIWGLAVIGVSIAALLCSLLLIAFLDIDLEIIRAARPGSSLRFLIQYVPILWIVLFVGFCFLIVSLLRRETRAYRYGWILVMGGVALGVGLLGVLLHVGRVSERAERYVLQGVPPHARPWMMRAEVLPRPEDGLLIGRVTEIEKDRIILIHAVSKESWDVRWNQPVPRVPVFYQGQVVMTRGSVIGPRVFEAEWIRIHRPPRRR